MYCNKICLRQKIVLWSTELYCDCNVKLDSHPLYVIHCVQMETASIPIGTRYYVMAVTPTRLYSFTGFGSLEVILTSYFCLILPLRVLSLELVIHLYICAIACICHALVMLF